MQQSIVCGRFYRVLADRYGLSCSVTPACSPKDLVACSLGLAERKSRRQVVRSEHPSQRINNHKYRIAAFVHRYVHYSLQHAHPWIS